MNEVIELVFTIDGTYGRLKSKQPYSVADNKYTINDLLDECDSLYSEYQDLESERDDLQELLDDANKKIKELEEINNVTRNN